MLFLIVFGALVFILSLLYLQVVPHITDAIQEWIERVAQIPVDGKEGPADVCVIELGGTIGKLIFLAKSFFINIEFELDLQYYYNSIIHSIFPYFKEI